MKKNTAFWGTLCSMLLGINLVYAQHHEVKQVILANGGIYEFTPPYSDHVTMATFNPENNEYVVFDTIYTESVQDIVIKDAYAYVTAQDSLIKYNLNDFSRAGAVAITGLNMLKIWNNTLIVGRANGVTENFVQLYECSDLSLIKSFPEISDESFGIETYGDTAYIAIPGNWMSTTGKVAVLDLQNKSFVREMDFGADGKGMKEIIRSENDLYIFNTMGWGDTYGTIINYNITNSEHTTFTINTSIGNGFSLCGIGIQNDLIYSIIDGNVGTLHLSPLSIADSNLISSTTTIADAVTDTVNNRIYITQTDYASFGICLIYSMNGDSLGSFITGISPQAMAIDYRQITNISRSAKQNNSYIFPNPFTTSFCIENISFPFSYRISDLSGRPVLSKENIYNKKIICPSLQSGIYFIEISDSTGSSTYRIVSTGK
jgi:hypothetical protein